MAPVIATTRTYLGLFLISLSTLMYEILLTRIFSVTMWYHFAFVAVSVAMFGMSAGAVIVYLFPAMFPPDRVHHRLAAASLAFSISAILSVLTHLSIPFLPSSTLTGVYSIALTYALVALPFVASGIAVCLALTRFPGQVSVLYGVDLLGAALGALLLVPLLGLTDGPDTSVAIAFLAGLAALVFAKEAGARRLVASTAIATVLFGTVSVLSAMRREGASPLFPVLWVKGQKEPPVLYEEWNSFSRVRVYVRPITPLKPFGWGLSATYPADRTIRQLMLDIDAAGATVLTEFGGDLEPVEHLKYDVSNLVHAIRRDAKVFVVGTGGGRDVLSALVFRQRSVIGVEVNPIIVDAVNGHFGEFTGHLDRIPDVRFEKDEARSYLARSRETFDIIQISLIDTWAATAAGAFVLTENAVYTVDAWKTFLSRLSPDGILSVTRWYLSERPDEMYRLTALAAAALKATGVQDPARHLYIVWHRRLDKIKGGLEDPYGVATLLACRRPFMEAELDTLDQWTRRLQFEAVACSRFYIDSTFARLSAGEDPTRWDPPHPVNIAPPTDDSPFFFHMLRLRDALARFGRVREDPNRTAVVVLGGLLLGAFILTSLLILLPFLFGREGGRPTPGSGGLFLYFAGIGFGFLLVELSQMQRLIVFLGHPTYGLSVVLVSLLLSSGVGSLLTRGVDPISDRGTAMSRLVLLVALLVVFGAVTPALLKGLESLTTPLRILVSVVLLFPIGVFMGSAFPLGMGLALTRSPALTPWLWGINGATSVCASVLSVAIALTAGISAAFWTGVGCYAVAAFAFARSSARRAP